MQNTEEVGKTAEVQDPVLAKPSGECCLKGHLHTGDPRGSTKTIAGVETYVSNPPKDKANGHIILYFPDVYGLFTNGRLVMDEFAAAGYLVLGLDYFKGDPVYLHRDGKVSKPGFDFESWLKKHTASADGLVPPWVQAVKKEYGKPDTKYACVGYCFGAPYVCNEAADNTVSAAAFAHPAFLKEHHFENLKKPLFLSCSEVDQTFPTESRNRAVDIMIEKKKDYQVQLFHGVEHGFALRCNLDVPYERYCKEQSVKAITEFFDFWLAQ